MFSKRLLFVAFTIMCAWESFAVPNVKFAISPTSEVSVSSITPGKAPAIAVGFFTPDISTIMPAFLLMRTNNSSRPIVGIQVLWTITDGSGHETVHRYACDKVSAIRALSPSLNRIRRCWSVRILTWIPLEQIPRYQKTPGFTSSFSRLQQFTSQFRAATSVSIRVDAIIFSDGEVVGTDEMGFADEIASRAAAASQVSRAVSNAKASGKVPSLELLPMTQGKIGRGDHMGTWKRRFAKQLIKSPNLSETLNYLQRLPTPPTFFRLPQTQK